MTCEHGGNRVPAEFRTLFAAHSDRLTTHRGWDPGALQLARTLARSLDAPLFATEVTRLLVEANRSLHHPRVFSDVTRVLPRAERDRIVDRWWRPLRASTERAIAEAARPTLHISAHSFTPVLDGETRDLDVGFLYDPKRAWERSLVRRWRDALRLAQPELRVRRNAPYRGDADGHTTALRRAFPNERYAGIEIEVNQAITTGPAAVWRRLRADLATVVATSTPHR